MLAPLKYVDYNLATIRELVDNALMEKQLRDLCLCHFSDIYDESKNRAELLRSLLEYANRQYLISRLLEEIKRINPNQYCLYEHGLVKIKIEDDQPLFGALPVLPSLIPLLERVIFALKNVKIVEQAFFDSSPKYTVSDKSPIEISDSGIYLFQCIDILAGFVISSRSEMHPLLRFISQLSNQIDDKNLKDKLENWVKESRKSIAISSEKSEHYQYNSGQFVSSKRDKVKSIICRFILQLKKEKAGANYNYKIQAWTRFIKDPNSSADKLRDERISDGEENFNCREKISEQLENWLGKIARHSYGGIDTRIEFFLPRDLLSEDVDQLSEGNSLNSVFLGHRYPVVVRPLERHQYNIDSKAAKAYENLCKRWDRLSESRYKSFSVVNRCDSKHNYCVALRIEQEIDQLNILAVDLIGDECVICSLLEYPPMLPKDNNQECVISTLIKEGIPIVLWIRQLPQDQKCEWHKLVRSKQSDNLKFSRDKLVSQIKEIRREAAKSDSWHMGAHLILLWDDPTLLHPDCESDSLFQSPHQIE